MSRINSSLQKLAPLFSPEGRLHRWYPLFEAIDSFIMGSRGTTAEAPHVRDAIDLKRIMTIVVI